jgi:hypothetical protein
MIFGTLKRVFSTCPSLLSGQVLKHTKTATHLYDDTIQIELLVLLSHRTGVFVVRRRGQEMCCLG